MQKIIVQGIADSHVRLQPPGITHSVYTLENTITMGGHFIVEEAMHLMEWARLVSHATDRVATNDVHVGILRTLGRMMIAMTTRGGTTGM